MEKEMSKKRGRRQQRSSRPRQRSGGPQLVTPEGDPLLLARAGYLHSAADEIRRILSQAGDFGLDDNVQPAPDGSVQFPWFETDNNAAPLAEPLSRRILATLTLTATTLTLDTVSRRRRRACRRRLEQLLGDRIHLVSMETTPMEQAVRERPRRPEPEPLILSPEAIAEIEERMLRQWLDESIPALGGLTPRQAAETAEGRKRLMDLLETIAADQARRQMPPGMFTPDYSKVPRMLGLE
jgi:Antitoxin Xre/MbcA/ParS C-terminal toxin-binding domain